MAFWDELFKKEPVFKIGIEENHLPFYTAATGEMVEMTPEQYNMALNENIPEDVSITYGLATMPMGLGATATKGIATKLMPYVGKKIGQSMAEGFGGGLVGGGVMGGIDAAQNGENIPLGILEGAGLGGLTGLAGGYGLGKFNKYLDAKGLKNTPNMLNRQNYYDNYVNELNNSNLVGYSSPYSKELARFKGLWQGVDNLESEGKYLFAGENALTADKNALLKAQNMFNNGIDNETIRQNTGWFKGADDKWRFEIPDNTATINDIPQGKIDYAVELAKFNRGIENNLMDLYRKGYNAVQPIEDLLNHKQFFKAYPEAKDIKNIIEYDAKYKGGWYPERETLNLNMSKIKDNKELKNTVLHELQHYIQEKEGFAPGGNLSLVDDSLGYKPYDFYKRIAGEAEARNVENRSNLGKTGLKHTPIEKTLDVPSNEIIHLDNNGNVVKFNYDENNLYNKLTKNLNYRDEWVKINGKDYRVLNLPKKDYGKILHILDTNIKQDHYIGETISKADDMYNYTFQKVSPTEYKFIKRRKLK